MNYKFYGFLCLAGIALTISYTSIQALYAASAYKEYYSHIILIPVISAYFFYEKREEIFQSSQYLLSAGIPVILIACVLFFASRNMTNLNQNNLTALTVFSAVVFVNGTFLTLFGLRAYKAASFSLLFLIFAVPIPSVVMDFIITALQIGSTEITELLFMITGTPYMREGFVFHLPGISIEVAKQCSGIRSTLALLITAILAGYMFLRTPWKIALLAFLTIPIAMLKNGIRIATLTIMSIHIDPRIIQSSLHREGGIPFFILGLCVMAPILFWLRRSDIKAGKIEVRTADGKQTGLLEPVMKYFRKNKE